MSLRVSSTCAFFHDCNTESSFFHLFLRTLVYSWRTLGGTCPLSISLSRWGSLGTSSVQLIVLSGVPWSCPLSNSLSCGASPAHAHCPTDCLVGRPWARPLSNSLSCGASPWHARCPTHCLVGRPLVMPSVQLIVLWGVPWPCARSNSLWHAMVRTFVHNIRCCIYAIPYLEDQPQRLIGRLGGGGRGPRHMAPGVHGHWHG